jgi:cell division cycle 14
MIIVLKLSPQEAFDTFKSYHGEFVPFRDASKGECHYECTILHCLQGLEQGIKHRWYDFKTFNVKEYEYYERVEHGDINWIIPGKFAAFMGPIDRREPGQRSGYTPEEYTDIFKEWNIKKVIRLNEAKYDRRKFLAQGVQHDELFFVDGSNPPEDIVEDFLSICDRHFSQSNPGAIAIHCKAGLGRTGTLIGLYAMKYYKIPAEQFIGWIRIARPGSVLGP